MLSFSRLLNCERFYRSLIEDFGVVDFSEEKLFVGLLTDNRKKMNMYCICNIYASECRAWRECHEKRPIELCFSYALISALIWVLD